MTALVPIIVSSYRSDEVDRVVAFEMGVDDYVSKPFSVRELVLRVDAVLRRAPRLERSWPGILEFGALRIDAIAHRVWVYGQESDLTALEFNLLVYLLEGRDRVRTREELLRAVWGVNAALTTRTVDTHVRRLRAKLGDASAYVETVRGVGYRFIEHPPARDSKPPSGSA